MKARRSQQECDCHRQPHHPFIGKLRNTKIQIDELAIFTIGLGVILAALVSWLLYASPPVPNRSTVLTVIPFAAAGLLVVLGLIVKYVRNMASIYAALAIISVMFLGDLLIGFNPIKVVISGAIVFMVIKVGRSALLEADGY